MELEEAKNMYKELKKNKQIIANIDTNFFFKFADTILQALDNSIPREKVENKIRELKNGQEIAQKDNWRNIYQYQILILEELLEEENEK